MIDLLLPAGASLTSLGRFGEAASVEQELAALALRTRSAEHLFDFTFHVAACAATRREWQRARDVMQTIDLRGALPERVGRVVMGMGIILAALDDAAGAEVWFRRALALSEQDDRPIGVAEAVGCLAELARRRGDLDEAERQYERSLVLLQREGGANEVFPRLNLALLALQRGRYGEANQRAHAVERTLREQGRIEFVVVALATRLPGTAVARDGAAFDAHLAEIERIVRETGFCHDDAIWPLELAADLAVEDPWRGAAARSVAADQRRRIALVTA
jgi:Tfp pilus assembly protein PilF